MMKLCDISKRKRQKSTELHIMQTHKYRKTNWGVFNKSAQKNKEADSKEENISTGKC